MLELCICTWHMRAHNRTSPGVRRPWNAGERIGSARLCSRRRARAQLLVGGVADAPQLSVPQLWSNWDGRLVHSAVMHTAADLAVPQCCLSDQCGENKKGMLQQQRMSPGPCDVATSRLRRLSWSLTAMARPNWCDSNSILSEPMGSEPDFDAAPVRMSFRMHFWAAAACWKCSLLPDYVLLILAWACRMRSALALEGTPPTASPKHLVPQVRRHQGTAMCSQKWSSGPALHAHCIDPHLPTFTLPIQSLLSAAAHAVTHPWPSLTCLVAHVGPVTRSSWCRKRCGYALPRPRPSGMACPSCRRSWPPSAGGQTLPS